MQTFLPSTNFKQSAKWLDRPSRLGKQRLEAIDCLKLNLHLNYGIPKEVLDFPEWLVKRYGNHPCRLMWSRYEWSLFNYAYIIIKEWRNCDYKDCCLDELERIGKLTKDIKYPNEDYSPPWLTEEFASNHRSILLGKVWEKLSPLNSKIIAYGKETPPKKLIWKYNKAISILVWYENWGWSELPAKRNESGKWPYMWPDKLEV